MSDYPDSYDEINSESSDMCYTLFITILYINILNNRNISENYIKILFKSNEITLKSDASSEGVGGRIFGGHEAEENEYPFIARMTTMTRQGPGVCGASIISDRWIITGSIFHLIYH